jgi:hypothetical protein
MMNRKWLPHIIAVVSLAVFVVLGLASDGGASTPSSYSSDSYSDSSGASSSSSQSSYLVIIYHDRGDGALSRHPYNIKASSEQEAIDEGVYRFVREFPKYSITNYTAVKVY